MRTPKKLAVDSSATGCASRIPVVRKPRNVQPGAKADSQTRAHSEATNEEADDNLVVRALEEDRGVVGNDGALLCGLQRAAEGLRVLQALDTCKQVGRGREGERRAGQEWGR